ncbi:MAG: glycosyltransferase family 4 protein [Pseudomonadales bacterium]
MLALCRYGQAGASSRLRTLQYVSPLQDQNIQVSVASLLDDAYLARLYARRPVARMQVAIAYAHRLAKMLGALPYDVLWVEKEAFPWLPAPLEMLLRRRPYLVDLDDAIFHRYDQHSSALVRHLFGRKLDQVMSRAAVVTAGNQYLAQRAVASGATDVRVIPTSVELRRYPVQQAAPAVFTVGWIGTPATAKFLLSIRGVLQHLHAQGGVLFRFIGAPADLALGVPYVAVPWSEATEAAELQRFSCGVMPLLDEPFERGKSGYKLIQYMACGLPAVASPVGANTDIVVANETGLFASTDAQWIEALSALRADGRWAMSLGQAGRSRVEALYSTATSSVALAQALHAAAAS